MGNLEISFTKIINYVDDGNLISALCHFQDEIRPIVETMETYENQEFLDILKEQCKLVDDENWNQVLSNIEKAREMLNES